MSWTHQLKPELIGYIESAMKEVKETIHRQVPLRIPEDQPRLSSATKI